MNVPRIRIVAEIGLTVALSAVLGLISVWQMPQGGSVSLVMLPILLLALRRGLPAGLAAGALYGVLDFILKPYFFHPVQVVLDYPLAFAACGLAGLFASAWTSAAQEEKYASGLWRAVLPGVAVGALGRYVAHVISGLVFFSSYAVEAGQAPLIYSAAYNSFVLVSAAACAILASAIMPALSRVEGGGSR
ncbi:MAG: energy-coupled thiamine transporter ThiT [Actinobacteria bacterium]|nr:energy-coupled thiamine transporter ThiT [Actinomycetota bacterium]